MLALPAPLCDEDKVPLVACGICLRRRQVQPAGRAFHAVHEKPAIQSKRKGGSKKEAASGKDGGAASDDEIEAPGDASWKKKRKEGGEKKSALKFSPLLVGVDLYALLEVNENASIDQIKKQYRKLALQHHPDKQGGADAGDTAPAAGDDKVSGLNDKDQLFIKIQEAYEILSDQSRRRQYDSTLDFDESVPEEVDDAVGFYSTFGPVFRRNARWSTAHPVPDLGDEKLDIAKVHKFYDFWFNFESWRDFSMHDEYNLEEAEFREERRWMERQNQRIRKKYQDTERRRVLRLAETAERLDPRIRAERAEKEAKKREEKERRARIKQEEEDAKRREEEERQLRLEKERLEKEEKERLEREQRKQSKQVTKALRQRLKKCIQCPLSAAENEELQDMSLSLEADALEALCGRLEALGPKEAGAAALAEVEAWKQRKATEMKEQEKQKEEARKRDEQKASAAKEAAAGAGAAWATEELGLLAKGLQKFPGGTGGRWALITQMINQGGYPRSEREVLEKVKEMSDGKNLRAMGSKVHTDLGAFHAPKAKAAPKAAAAAPEPEKPHEAEPAKAGADKSSLAGAEWSPEQQKALEAALQKHPASLDKNERWRLIAEEVPGKTKAQCVERFKYLREQLSKQKKG